MRLGVWEPARIVKGKSLGNQGVLPSEWRMFIDRSSMTIKLVTKLWYGVAWFDEGVHMATWRHVSSSDDRGSGMERRRHVRYAGDGLMVMIDDRLHPAADISLGGVRIASSAIHQCGTVLPVRLIPVVEEAMLLGQAVRTEAQVVGYGRDGLRMVFLRVHPSMARLVKGHARRQWMNRPFSEA